MTKPNIFASAVFFCCATGALAQASSTAESAGRKESTGHTGQGTNIYGTTTPGTSMSTPPVGSNMENVGRR
jgi:hypothetical protein